jgi:hypothetical protein
MRSDRGWKLKGPLVALTLLVPLAPLPPLPPLALLLPMPLLPLLVQLLPLLLQLSLLLPPMALLVGRCCSRSLKTKKAAAPEDGYALGESMYGDNTSNAGGSSRRGSAVPKGVWVFVKRIKHPGLRTRLLANGQIMHTHVCIKCWVQLKLGYVSTEQRFVTAAAVAHLRLNDSDETGGSSNLKQIAKTASITLGMLGAGDIANYVVRAATCQVENISICERRLRRTVRPGYRRQQGGGWWVR